MPWMVSVRPLVLQYNLWKPPMIDDGKATAAFEIKEKRGLVLGNRFDCVKAYQHTRDLIVDDDRKFKVGCVSGTSSSLGVR